MIKCASTEAEFKQLTTMQQKKMEELTWSVTHEGADAHELKPCSLRANLNWPGVCLRGCRAGYLDTTENTSPWAAQLELTAELRIGRRPHTVQSSTAQCISRSLAVGCADQGLMAGSPCRFKVSQTHSRCRGLYKLKNIFLNKEKLNLECPEVAAEEARYSSEERDVTGRTELVVWS